MINRDRVANNVLKKLESLIETAPAVARMAWGGVNMGTKDTLRLLVKGAIKEALEKEEKGEERQ